MGVSNRVNTNAGIEIWSRNWTIVLIADGNGINSIGRSGTLDGNTRTNLVRWNCPWPLLMNATNKDTRRQKGRQRYWVGNELNLIAHMIRFQSSVCSCLASKPNYYYLHRNALDVLGTLVLRKQENKWKASNMEEFLQCWDGIQSQYKLPLQRWFQ